MSSNRLDLDSLFMMTAVLMAERGTCARAKVGAVIVKDRRIISTGYVGAPPGEPHCIDQGCQIDEKTGGCIRTVHAEANAIAHAARSGLRIEGATLYSTMSPCTPCGQLALSSGIARVVCAQQYRDPSSLNVEKLIFNAWTHPFIGYPSMTGCLLCGLAFNQHS